MMNWVRCATRVLGAISTAIPLLLAPLQAQEAPLLERGATVRFASQALDRHSSTGTPSGRSDRATSVAYARGKAVTAIVLSSDADTVYVRLSTGGHVAVPWESLEWMEKRSSSRRRTIVISTAIGAAAVGVPLAILGVSVWEEDEPINQVVCAWGYPGCKGKNRWQSPAEQAFALGVMGAAVGGGIGFVAGAMGVFDSWYPVRMPARLEVVPGREGAGFTASIRF